MIHDVISRFGAYPFSSPFRLAFEFLRTVTLDTPDGTVELDGTRLYAMVQSYATEPEGMEPDRLEVHRRYLDIQYAVSGVEVLACVPSDGLCVQIPYCEKTDAEFLVPPDPATMIRLPMIPGRFAIFLPTDAHAGRLFAPSFGAQRIKKVVVKADASLFPS